MNDLKPAKSCKLMSAVGNKSGECASVQHGGSSAETVALRNPKTFAQNPLDVIK